MAILEFFAGAAALYVTAAIVLLFGGKWSVTEDRPLELVLSALWLFFAGPALVFIDAVSRSTLFIHRRNRG